MARKIPVDKDEAKRVRKLLSKCKNSRERLRVMIVSTYLGGKNTEETGRSLGTFQSTVIRVTDQYIADKEGFYKTKYKGKKTSDRNKEIKEEVKRYIDESIEKEEPVDINDVRRMINKMYKEEVLDYGKCWAIVRKFFRYNYQKPYVTHRKQSEYAKEIAEGRLRKAIFKVAIEERKIDADAIKNKKTKFGRVER